VRTGLACAAVPLLIGLCVTLLPAQSLRLSPVSVAVDVPAAGSSQVEFVIYDFTGELDISLEDIPLTVAPETVSVNASARGSKVVLTLYGDSKRGLELGSETYCGYIRFLARTGGLVALGIKVRATVNHVVEDGPSPTIPLHLAAGIAASVAVATALLILRRRRSARTSA